jgi:hypothetical protein
MNQKKMKPEDLMAQVLKVQEALKVNDATSEEIQKVAEVLLSVWRMGVEEVCEHPGRYNLYDLDNPPERYGREC